MPDDNSEALNIPAEEENSQDDTPSSETNAPEEDSADDQQEDSSEGESKKGATQRIRQLNQRARDAEDKVQTLEERLKEVTESSSRGLSFQEPKPDEPIVKDGEEITAAELDKRLAEREKRILEKAAQTSQFESQRQRVIDRIQREAAEVMGEYPELNPDNGDKFDSDISDIVTEATEAYVKSNPTGSVKKFVKGLMTPYRNSVSKEVTSRQKELAKQAAETATRPTSVSKGEKDFSQLSVKEMEEQLGIVTD